MCRSKSFTIIRYWPSLYLRYARRRRQRREAERHDFVNCRRKLKKISLVRVCQVQLNASILHREYGPHNVNNGRNRAAMAAVAAVAAAASSETCIRACARVTREKFHTAAAQQRSSAAAAAQQRSSAAAAAAESSRSKFSAVVSARIHNERVFHGPTGWCPSRIYTALPTDERRELYPYIPTWRRATSDGGGGSVRLLLLLWEQFLLSAFDSVTSVYTDGMKKFNFAKAQNWATSWSLLLLLTRASHVHERREREDLEELELARRIDEHNCSSGSGSGSGSSSSRTRKIRENFIVLVLDATAWKSTGSTIAGAIHTYIHIAIDVRVRARLSLGRYTCRGQKSAAFGIFGWITTPGGASKLPINFSRVIGSSSPGQRDYLHSSISRNSIKNKINLDFPAVLLRELEYFKSGCLISESGYTLGWKEILFGSDCRVKLSNGSFACSAMYFLSWCFFFLIDLPPSVNVKSRQVGERASRAAFIEFLQSRTSYLFRYRRKKKHSITRVLQAQAHTHACAHKLQRQRRESLGRIDKLQRHARELRRAIRRCSPNREIILPSERSSFWKSAPKRKADSEREIERQYRHGAPTPRRLSQRSAKIISLGTRGVSQTTFSVELARTKLSRRNSRQHAQARGACAPAASQCQLQRSSSICSNCTAHTYTYTHNTHTTVLVLPMYLTITRPVGRLRRVHGYTSMTMQPLSFRGQYHAHTRPPVIHGIVIIPFSATSLARAPVRTIRYTCRNGVYVYSISIVCASLISSSWHTTKAANSENAYYIRLRVCTSRDQSCQNTISCPGVLSVSTSVCMCMCVHTGREQHNGNRTGIRIKCRLQIKRISQSPIPHVQCE
ncbi:unnamed protein product [Trichogramma brassicae]|uniref:Uncharacterized protein n=1 Tax=Trichogramma brassicae TaxID=86971 RepID=A0A6H5IRH2_9HYME|nr:unnamed protein product [Trichogramma brassicae]